MTIFPHFAHFLSYLFYNINLKFLRCGFYWQKKRGSPDESDTLALTDGEVLGETADALALIDGDKLGNAVDKAV